MTEYIVIGVVVAVIIAIIIAWSINRAIFKKYDRVVRETSPSYKNLSKLNQRQNFHTDISNIYKYAEYPKSRRGVENFNFQKFLTAILYERENAFYDVFAKCKQNKNAWDKYCDDCEKAKIFVEENEFEKIVANSNEKKLKYKKYNQHEQRIFEQTILRLPTITTSIYLLASYTSPAGQSHAQRSCNISHEDVYATLLSLKEMRAKERIRLAKERDITTRQQVIENEEREMLKKNRELEKKVQRLEKEKEELQSKEQEFQLATKGHIYSAEATKESADDFDNLSPYEQLKRLKQMLDDGDIDYDEYNQKRKEIAG